MTYTQADIDYYHDVVDKRDAEIENLKRLIGELFSHDGSGKRFDAIELSKLREELKNAIKD